MAEILLVRFHQVRAMCHTGAHSPLCVTRSRAKPPRESGAKQPAHSAVHFFRSPSSKRRLTASFCDQLAVSSGHCRSHSTAAVCYCSIAAAGKPSLFEQLVSWLNSPFLIAIWFRRCPLTDSQPFSSKIGVLHSLQQVRAGIAAHIARSPVR